MGFTRAVYLDDCINMNRSSQECWENTKQIIQTFRNFGFTVHSEPKSVLHPSLKIEFLGFILNSVTMKITLTDEKKIQLQSFCTKIFLAATTNIRTIDSILGKITSSFPVGGVRSYKIPKHRLHFSKNTALP